MGDMAPREDSAASFSTASILASNNMALNDVEDGGAGRTKRGYHLRWSRITKTVDIKRKNGGLMGPRASMSASFKPSTMVAQKTILSAISGSAAPGQVLSLMGLSGSGKTSLLNCLAGRSSFQDGILSINGEPVSPATMKRLMTAVGYVKQSDVFFGHLTVRDQLTYTALLRLKADATDSKHAEVDRVLSLLRLQKVADSPINMLSGGERKRVNIGTELLTDPAVLLLDEPSSGLDSTSAVSLLRLLERLAREHGKTVIASIHQPSSAVFHSFDRLMLLSEGRVVYFGTPIDSLQYLRRHNLACPDGYNAADHWMDMLMEDDSHVTDTDSVGVSPSAVEDDLPETLRNPKGEDSGRPNVSPRRRLEQAWDSEAVAEQMDREMKNTGPKTDNSALPVLLMNFGRKYNTTWWTQYLILTHRALKNSRSAIFTPLNLCKSLAIGLVAGMLWFQTDYTERNVNDIRSYYFFSLTFWIFDAMFTALTAFPSERDVILKERASGSYHLSAYFMAKTTADAPVRLLLPLIYMIISFWMAGMSNSFSVFCGTIACTLMSVLSGEAIGLLVGAAVYDLQRGLTIMTVFTLFLMLLGGFFVENVPAFISWGKYISPFKYAFDFSLQLIFDRDVPCDGSGALKELCDTGGDVGFATVDEVRNFIGIQGTIAFNVGMLLVLCFVPRYGAYVCLRRKKGDDRS